LPLDDIECGRLEEKIDNLTTAVHDAFRLLRGDGNGNKGLLPRLTTLELYAKQTRFDLNKGFNLMRSCFIITGVALIILYLGHLYDPRIQAMITNWFQGGGGIH
jgi:hypothetical protein